MNNNIPKNGGTKTYVINNKMNNNKHKKGETKSHVFIVLLAGLYSSPPLP